MGVPEPIKQNANVPLDTEEKVRQIRALLNMRDISNMHILERLDNLTKTKQVKANYRKTGGETFFAPVVANNLLGIDKNKGDKLMKGGRMKYSPISTGSKNASEHRSYLDPGMRQKIAKLSRQNVRFILEDQQKTAEVYGLAQNFVKSASPETLEKLAAFKAYGEGVREGFEEGKVAGYRAGLYDSLYATRSLVKRAGGEEALQALDQAIVADEADAVAQEQGMTPEEAAMLMAAQEEAMMAGEQAAMEEQGGEAENEEEEAARRAVSQLAAELAIQQAIEEGAPTQAAPIQ